MLPVSVFVLLFFFLCFFSFSFFFRRNSQTDYMNKIRQKSKSPHTLKSEPRSANMRQPIFFLWCAFLLCFDCFPFFLTFQNTRQRRAIRGRSAQSRGRRDPREGRRDPEEGRHVGDGKRQRDGGCARVRREENKDRIQSNQQQLNA